MGFFSKKDKSNKSDVATTSATPTVGAAPSSMPTPPGAPRPPMAPPMSPSAAPSSMPTPPGAPRPPMAPGSAPTAPMAGAPRPPMPTPPGAPRPPMAPGSAPTAPLSPSPSPAAPASFGAPRPMTPTPNSPVSSPSFGPSAPSSPSFNTPRPMEPNTSTSMKASDPYAQMGLKPTNLGGGNRNIVYDMNIDELSSILDIDLEAGRVPKETFGSNPDVAAVKSYINRLSIRKQELLAIESQLKARKQELESKLPKKKSSTKKKAKPALTSKTGSSTAVKTTEKKKPAAKKPEKPEIPKTQKHKIITLKEFDDYNYDKRRKDWHKLAGYNEKQEVCSICKDDDNWTSIKLNNGNHICYFCWIKKPTTASRKAVQTSKSVEKSVTAPVVQKQPKKNIKNAKYNSTGKGKELYEYAKSAETRTQLKTSKVGSSSSKKPAAKKPTAKKSTANKKPTPKKAKAKSKTKKK